MKKRFSAILFLTVVFMLIAAAFVVQPAHAASLQDTAPAAAALPPLDLSAVLVTFASLSGVALFITALVNTLKVAGVVKDDSAPKWSAGLNLFVLIGVIVLQVLGKTNLVPAIDSQAGTLANILVAITGLVFQIFLSKKAHTEALAGLPVIGASNSGRVAGESLTTLDVTYDATDPGAVAAAVADKLKSQSLNG